MPKTEWLKATASGAPVGVDRERRVINGFVVAQAGAFKSEGRGEFDSKSLKSIVSLMKQNKAGTRSRFTHPTLSSDGLGTHLGRAHNPRLDTVNVGKERIEAVRADLHLNPASEISPNGNLGEYILRLAETDPDAMSSSLVLMKDDEYQLEKGRRKIGENGQELPPLWRPTKILASDIVDTGDAVDGLLGDNLSFAGLRDADVRLATQLLDRQFAKMSKEEIEQRCGAWVKRYLAYRFPEDGDVARRARARLAKLKIRDMELEAA